MLLTAAFLMPTAFAQPAPATNALPSGGQVVAGQVTMSSAGTAGAPTLNVAQGSDRAIVNWQGFDVGRDATVRFAQPSASSAILNRVVGTDASRIFGRVEANGQVFLVNPQGIYFSPTSSVDVGSFVASTLSIGDADFLAGRLNFRRDGALGSVVNEGTIRSALGSYVALLAPEVRNAGLIMAEAGTVVLAAGEAVSFNFDPTSGVTGLLVEPARVQALVDNRRIVRAPGGQVIVSAQAHNELAAGVIRNTGEIVATGIAQDGGRIYLGASDTVEQGGLVDASAAAGKGGDVTLVAPTIALLDDSSLLADGELGGGRIRVGGDWQGIGPLPQSCLVTMATTALVDASARRFGMGGEVVLWSDVHDAASRTLVAGSISARGGELGGDGGRVETSGHVLDVGALRVDTRAPSGATGIWLLDPVNITIATSGGNLTPDQLRDGLLTSNVTISTAGSGSAIGVSPTYTAGAGDITVSSAINSTSSNSLTLIADNQITVNAAMALGGALNLNATANVTFNAAVATSAGGITVSAAGLAGAGTITIPSGSTLSLTLSGNSVFTGVIDGAGALSKAGAGTLALTGASTFSGGSTVTAGTIGVYHETALGSGAVSIGGATLRFGRTLAQFGNDIALTGATTFVFDTSVDYLLVGGGGGGGAHVGGGGGGGGVLMGSTTLTSGTSAVSVGIGGTGSTNTSVTTRTAATGGANTTAFGFIALGGGAGGNFTSIAATSGASGGGQGANNWAAAAGTAPQGFAGGLGDGVATYGYLAGGGGGAGGVGGSAVTNAGNGGIGLLSAITGTGSYYGGGGGGGVHTPGLGSAGLGGLGGGGNGAVDLQGVRAPDGGANTGGGGGGTGAGNFLISIGGNGGSGVVAISYLGALAGTGGTVSAGSASAVGRTLHTFNTTGAGSLVLSALSTALSGTISGAGALTVNATGGTISFTGGNTSTGTTTISGGVLRVGAGGATGALGAGAITNQAALVFSRAGTLTVAATIAGTGSVEQLGSGVTVLSGDVSHTGGTTVTAGTLRVGASGTTGTLAGNVVTQGVLAFDRSDVFTFAGAISGAGGVTQAGSSNLILSGAATFTGVTAVSAGGVVFRRDVPPSTSGFTGVGPVTIEPATASFTSAFTPAYSFASTLTGLTLGKSGNASGVTIGSAIGIAGPIQVFGGDVTISANVSSTGVGQPIVFQAVSNILQNAARTIQTNGGDIVYWSNTGGATTGNRGILISDSSVIDSRTAADRTAATHTTGGGVIVLGGGSTTATSAKGTTIPTGYALNYTSVPSGLMIGSYNAGVGHNANVRMFSGGGDVVWRGRSTQNVATLTVGISAFEGVIVNAGTTGDITVDGVAVGNTTAAGMDIHGWRTGVANSSYLTVDGDILFTGSGTGATNNVGTQLGSSVGFPIILAATGAGTVTIRGATSGTASDINITDVQLLSGLGSVSMLVDRAGGKLSIGGTNATAKLGQAASSVVTSSSASILLRADVFDVTSTNGVAINTTGAVEFTSYNATGFTAAPAFSRLDVGRPVASAANSIASFTFGKTTNTSVITLATGSVNAQGPIRMYGSDLTIGIPLRTDATSAEILLQTTGFLKTSANLTTTGSTSPLRLFAGGYFYVTAASTWTTTGSDVLVATNTDGSGGGYILGAGNQSIVTSGGAVTMAGGDATGTGYAEGMTTVNAEGIRFYHALSIDTSVKTSGVSTGGGNITLRGKSATTAGYAYGAWGVGVDGASSFDSGTGVIRVDGICQVTSGDSYSMGIRLSGVATMTSAATSATAIHITGTGGSAGSSFSGSQAIRIESAGNRFTATGAGGGISVIGTNGAASIWAVVSQGSDYLAASGPIVLAGTNANSALYLLNAHRFGSAASTAVTSSSANVTLRFGDHYFNSWVPVIRTTGSFTAQPVGAAFVGSVYTSWYDLPTTLSGLTIGSATNTAYVYANSALTVLGPVTLQGGYIEVTQAISAAGDILLDGDTGSGLAASIYGVYANATISTTAASNGSITLTGRGGNAASNFGVYLNTASSLTAGGSGAISVTGIGGANAGAYNYGILVYSSLTTGAGALTLTGTGGGTGGSSVNRGIYTVGNIVFKTTTGALTLIGTGGVGANSEAFYLNDAMTLGAVSQSGDITLRGNSFLINAGNLSVLTSGSLTIEPTGTSFTSALSTQKFTLPALLTSATLGKGGNTADITVANAISTSGAITITGGAVALGGALSSTGGDIGITSATLTGAGGITIPGMKTLTITQSGTSTYDGAISGGGSLVKAGAGTLALSASSGFTGTTSISAGTLALGGGGTTGWLTATSSIAVDGTLQIWRGDDVTLNLPLTGAGTIEVRGAYRTLFNSYLTTTAQTVAPNTTVAEVMRRIVGGAEGGTAVPGTKEAAAYQINFDPIANVGRFQLQQYDSVYTKTVFVKLVQSGANVQALVEQVSPYTNGTGYVTSNGLGQSMVTYAGVVYDMPLATSVGAGGYGVARLDVAGKVTLSNIGSFAGTLKLTTATETGPTGNLYAKTIPGTLEVTSGFGNLSSIVNNGLLYLNQAADTTLPNTISGTGGVIKLGAGNTTFAAAATFTGETTVAAGRLTYQDVYGSSVHTILSGCTLALDVASGDRDYAATTFRGTGTLVKSGAGRALWSTSVATFALGSGAMIDVQGGTLTGSVSSNDVWTNNYADLNVASGAAFAVAEGSVRVDALTGSGDVTIGGVSSTGLLSLGVDNHTAGAFSTAGSATFSGVIADASVTLAGAVTKLGTGTQIFSGANAYTRGTTLSAGTLRIGAGGTVGILTGGVVNNASLIFDRSDDTTFVGVISGTGTVVKLGAGVLTLTGANTFSGVATITGGTLRIGNGATAGTLGAGNITNNSVLDFTRTDLVAVTGVISGTGSVTSAGGTVVLTGANTYSGGTTITGGVIGAYHNAALGSGTLTVGDATLRIGRTVTTLANALTLTGDVTVDLDATVEYLIVGGGGGGGGGQASFHGGGGGGGGGVRSGSADFAAGSYALSIGAGGTAGAANASIGGTGGSSAFGGVTALGGGGGGQYFIGAPTVGASGGGGAVSGTVAWQSGAAGTVGQGFAGGNANGASPNAPAGGGGGAGGAGGNFSGTSGGAGGLGLVSAISGTQSFYGGGGGGGGTLGGAGGSGVGGSGGAQGTAGIAGTSNTGSGGGGGMGAGGSSATNGALGGAGVVVVRYLGGAAGSGGTITAGTNLTAGYTLHTFTTTGASTLTLSAALSTTLSGAITGTGAFTTDATGGTITLTGANTYDGATTIPGGTVRVGAGGATGALGAGAITNNGSLVFNRTGTVTVAGVISGTGTLEQAGPGTTVLEGVNTYSGATTISAGTLAVTDAAGLGATAAGTTVASGASLDLRGVVVGTEALTLNGGTLATSTGTSSLAGAVTLGASSTLNVGGTQLTLGGIVSGATFGLTKTGTGVAVLSGANTFTGNLAVDAGTLRIGGTGLLGFGTYVGAINVASGATFSFASSSDQVFGTAVSSGNVTNASSNTLRGAGSFLFAGSGTVTLRGDFSATGAVEASQAVAMTGGTNNLNAGLGLASGIDIKSGGTITLGGQANSFIGFGATAPLIIRTGGKLTTSGASGQTFHLGLITLAGGELATGPGTTTTVWGVYNLDRTITITEDSTISAQFSAMYQSGGTGFNVAAGKTLTISGTLNLPSNGGETGLVLNSAAGSTGTMVLTGANTYAAATTITRGALRIGGAGSLGSGTYANTVTNNGALEIASSANQTLSNVISGTGSVTKSGAGTAILTAMNTYTGATTVSAGVLQVGNGGTTGSLSASTAVSITSGATLRYYRADIFPASFSVAHAVSGDGTLEFKSTGGNGAGQFKLTGVNTLSASAVILLNQARLVAETLADLSASLPLVRVLSGGQLYINRTGTFANPLELGAGLGWKETDGSQLGVLHVPSWGAAGVVTLTGDVTFTGNSSIAAWANQADVTISGVISDGGNGYGFTKLGTLKVILTGANTFTGTTTITTGTVQVGTGGTTGLIGGPVVNNAALIFDRSDDLTFALAISGTGTLTKAGANTLTLTGANTYTGATTVTAGGIVFRRDTAPSTSGFTGAGTVTLESAGTAFTSAVASYTYASTVTGLTIGKSTNTSAVTLGSAISIAGPVAVYGGNIAATAAITATGDLLLDADTGAQLSGNFTGLAVSANLATTAGSNGNITLRGRGGDNSAGGQLGINIATGVTVSAGGNGIVLIEGNGGTSVGSGNIGIRSYGTITTGAGSLTLTGVAGGVGASSNNNDGIAPESGAVIRSAAGNILLDATCGPGGSSEAIAFESSSSAVTIGQVSQTGSTTLRGDIFWVSTINVSLLGTGAITIEPKGTSFASAQGTDRFTIPSVATAFTFGKSGNTAALTVAANLSVAGPISVYGGDVTLSGSLAATAAGNILVRSSGVLTIAASKVLSTTGGDIALTAARFVNNGASGALSAGGTGKTWRVWSTNADPYHGTTGDVAGGLAFDFRQYDASYGVTTVQGASKGLLYSYAPSLTASFSTTPTKIYNQSDAATVTNSMVTVSTGYAGGDGTAVFTFASATYASRNAGNGQAITFASAPTVVAQSSAGTGGKPVYGYRISGLSAPTGTITPLALTLAGVTASNKVYDRSLTASVTGGSVTALGGDTVTVDTSSATGAFADWNVGTTKTVTISGVVLGGAEAGNYSVAQPSGLTANITARPLSVTGVTTSNKTYDRTVTAALSGGAVTALTGDTVILVASGASGIFADWNVGTGKAVSVSGYTLTGTNAGNYAIVQPTGVIADITALSLAVTGVTASNKVYDRSVTATLSGGSISPISGDTVTLDDAAAAGVFADWNVSTAKAVTVTGYALAGAGAGNYAIAQPTGVTANITALSLTISGATAANRVYDRTLTAVVSGGTISPISGDTVTLDDSGAAGAFATKVAGTGKSVAVIGYTISGTHAGNYSVIQPTGLTADITARSLSVSGLAPSKTYDRSVSASLSGATVAPISGDTVSVDDSAASGSFADWNVGTGKLVNYVGFVLTGGDAANYALVQPTGVTADITALTLNVTGATAANKTYDRSVSATLSGGAIAPISGDTVSLVTSGRAGVFGDKNVGIAKAVTVSGYAIAGADAGNYVLVQPTGVTADITQLTLNVTGATAANKTYDALLAAAISGGAISVILGDAVTLDTTNHAGLFGDKNIGTGKSVTVSGYTISGTDAGNYNLVQPTGVTADITALMLNVTGATAANKTYDALLAAAISGGSISAISGDAVTLDTTGRAGLFADKNVGTSKGVAVSGYTISGSDAGNYALVQPTGVTADIAALTLNVTGATAANKTYDALLSAAISGGSIAPISGDTVSLVTSGRAGVFGDKNVGIAKAVTVSGYAISGADAGNYVLVQPTGVTADITALTLNITGATAANKTYDALLAAAISGGAISVISGDTVTLSTTSRAGLFGDKNIGTGKSVTVSGYAISGADAANYALVQPTGVTADITALMLNVTGATAANKTYDRSVSATLSGGAIAPISGDTVSLVTTGRAGVFGDKNVGIAKAVTVSGYAISGADAGNYSLVQPTGVTADITALMLNVTGVTAANKTYDALLAAAISGGSISAISGDVVALVTSVRAGVFGDKNVGIAKAVTVSGYTISGTDAGNYALVQPTGVTADITQLTLNVTGATAANKTYDALLAASISGGAVTPISGDTVTLVTSGRAGVFGDKNIGTAKAVAASGYVLAGSDAGNYIIAQPTGVTANITALSLAITGVSAANKTYDALLTTTLSGGAIAPISGDTVTLVTSGRAGVFGDKNVGIAKAVAVSGYAISGADAGNYSLVQPTGVTADITQLTLNVTGATAANKTYDALLAAAISGGAIGGISGDTVTLDTTNHAGLFGDKNIGTGKSVTVFGYAISGADAANYALVQPTGVTADITQLTLNVTGATAANKTYDALLTAAITGGAISAISGDTVTLVNSSRAGAFADKNVGTAKAVTVSGYTISGADAGNYALVQPTGITADVTVLSLAVTGVTAANKTYDRSLTATLSGGSVSPLSGDIVTLDTSSAAGVFADWNVGSSKAVAASGYAISGMAAANYALAQPTGVTADVTALSLAVTGVTAANKTYDRTAAATLSGGSVSPLSGDTVTLDTSSAAGVFANWNVGTAKAVTAAGYALGGANAGNYAIAQPTGLTADISALSLAVTGVTAANKNYDRTVAATLSGGAVSPISGDIATLDDSSAAGVFANWNVGTAKAVTASGYALIGTHASNYVIVQPAGLTADITALSLAVTGATAASKTYDALLAAAISGGAVSVISGDTVTLNTSGRAGAFADKNVGTAKAVTVSGYTLSGADAGNYALVQPAVVNADITQLPLNVTGATAANKTYDALLAAAISGGLISPISGDTATLDVSGRTGAFADKNVGTAKAVTVSGYTISGTDAGNYALVQPIGLTADITQLTLNVTGATAANKTYDALLAASISGGAVTPISGDTVTLVTSGRAGVFGDKNVGNSKAVTVIGYTISGVDAGNYVLAQPIGASADITVLSLAVTGATAATKTYDALRTATVSGGTISPLSGDGVTLDASARAGFFGDKNVGTAKAVTVSGYTISGTDAGNYALTQPTGVTADITPLTINVTGATAANKTYDSFLTSVISGGSISVTSGDTVVLDSTNRAGLFADKNVGTGKSVTVSGYTLSGADAANYALAQPTGVTAEITPLTLNVTGVSAANKTYDVLLTASVSGGAISVISGDTVTLIASGRAGVFADKNVGTGKSVTVSGYTTSGTDAANYALVQPTGLTADITPLTINVTGATAANKTYDSFLTSVISGGSISVISGDTVVLDSTNRAGLFADKNVGTGKSVTVSGYTLSGADAPNYALVQPTGVTAEITPLTLNVTGVSAAHKTYDALHGAIVSGGSIGAISGDIVTLDASNRSGLFADKNVGMAKAVMVSGYALTGADAGNYDLVQPTGVAADVTQLTLNITGATAANKTYDAQLTGAISGGSISAIAGDTVTLDTSNRSGLFADKNVGAGKAVAVSGYALTGADAGNYDLVQPAGLSANITQLTMDLTGVTATDKTYDGLQTATLSGGRIAPITGDTVILDTTNRAGLFADKNVGTGKSVTVSGYTLSGTDAANYALAQPTGVTAGITLLTLNVTGATATNKTYDSLLAAAISGGAISPISGDLIALDSTSRAGVFADKNVGTGKAVTVSGYSISGADAANYSLVQPMGVSADITPAGLVISGLSVNDKTYDRSLSATLTGGAVTPFTGDAVILDASSASAVFVDWNVGAGKPVTVSGYALIGADAGNYVLTQPSGLTADIFARSLPVMGVLAANKLRNGSLSVEISGGSITPLAGDTVTLDTSAATGVFLDDMIGVGKPVTVSGYALTGADAGNYAITQPTGVTANINDAGVFYPPVEAAPGAVFLESAVTVWAPPTVFVTLQGLAKATPKLVVSTLSMPTSAPEFVPVGRMLTISTNQAVLVTEVSVEVVIGFVAGDTVLQLNASEGLKVTVDNTTGKVMISGEGSPAAYDKVLKTLAVHSSGGNRVGGITLRIGVSGTQGGKSTTTIQLRQGNSTAAAK